MDDETRIIVVFGAVRCLDFSMCYTGATKDFEVTGNPVDPLTAKVSRSTISDVADARELAE